MPDVIVLTMSIQGPKKMFALTLSAVLMLLSACSTSGDAPQTAAPVVSLSSHKLQIYRVREGDTLYSIAFAYGVDYGALAQLNHLHKPYRFVLGQKLKIPQAAANYQGLPSRLGSTPVSAHRHHLKPGAKARYQARKVAKHQAIKLAGKGQWPWPAVGKLVQGFEDGRAQGNQGIDIQGCLHSPIKAVQSGTVVYSGEGLKGYGKLILIKHNDTLISAYAHNDKLLVREGNTVHVGQKIALMGEGEHSKPALHFEIRRQGQPIDPLSLLRKSHQQGHC